MQPLNRAAGSQRTLYDPIPVVCCVSAVKAKRGGGAAHGKFIAVAEQSPASGAASLAAPAEIAVEMTSARAFAGEAQVRLPLLVSC